MVVFKTSQGLDMQGTLLKLTRFQVAFEVCGPAVLRTSEVLLDFKIVMQDKPVYCGRAVISELVNTGNCARVRGGPAGCVGGRGFHRAGVTA